MLYPLSERKISDAKMNPVNREDATAAAEEDAGESRIPEAVRMRVVGITMVRLARMRWVGREKGTHWCDASCSSCVSCFCSLSRSFR